MARANRVQWTFAAAVAVVSCGGFEPSAQSPSPSPVAASAAAATPSAEPPASEPSAEPAAPAELAQGIKAFDEGRYAQARAAFEVASSKSPRSGQGQARYDLGMACEKLGDRAAAERAYNAALSVQPDLETASVALSSLLIDAGRGEEASSVAHAGLGFHGNSALLHENLGIALAATADRDAARRELEAAVALVPGDTMMRLTLAHWLNAWHEPGARPHLDVARRLAKADVPMLLAVGLEYRLAGEFASCAQTLDQAISIKDGGEARTERGLCRLGSKDDKGALDDLVAAVTVEPTYAPGHYYLAGRLAKAGDFAQAATEYGKYLELAPSGSLARAATERRKAASDQAMKSEKKH
jgi:Flp pilus assembly protein TadD